MVILEQQHFLMNFEFVEVFDTSADGVSGGRVRIGNGYNHGIGKQRLIIILTPSQPGANISLFLVAYGRNVYTAGPSFMSGRLTPALRSIYWYAKFIRNSKTNTHTIKYFSNRVNIQNQNFDETTNATVSASHSAQVQGEIGLIYATANNGRLELTAGGIESSHFTVDTESAPGASVYASVYVYGNTSPNEN